MNGNGGRWCLSGGDGCICNKCDEEEEDGEEEDAAVNREVYGNWGETRDDSSARASALFGCNRSIMRRSGKKRYYDQSSKTRETGHNAPRAASSGLPNILRAFARRQ